MSEKGHSCAIINIKTAEAGHTDDSDTRNRGVNEFCSGVKESEGVE